MSLILLLNTVTPVATLLDGFNDGTIDTAKWAVSYIGTPGSATETGGQLLLAHAAGANGVALTSVNMYDVADGAVFVQLVDPGEAATGASEAMLQVRLNGTMTDRVVIFASGTQLYFYRILANVESSTSITYDSVAHRWLRIRETTGTLYWETAPDGVTWTVRRSLTTDIAMSPMDVRIVHGSLSGASPASTAIFDNLNVYAVGPPAATVNVAARINRASVTVAPLPQTVTVAAATPTLTLRFSPAVIPVAVAARVPAVLASTSPGAIVAPTATVAVAAPAAYPNVFITVPAATVTVAAPVPTRSVSGLTLIEPPVATVTTEALPVVVFGGTSATVTAILASIGVTARVLVGLNEPQLTPLDDGSVAVGGGVHAYPGLPYPGQVYPAEGGAPIGGGLVPLDDDGMVLTPLTDSGLVLVALTDE